MGFLLKNSNKYYMAGGVIPPPPPPVNDYLCFTALEDGSTVAMQRYSYPPECSLEYKVDDAQWQTFRIGEETITLSLGSKLYFRGSNDAFAISAQSPSNYHMFVTTGQLDLSGNIETLRNKNGDKYLTSGCYAQLFRNCSAIKSCSLKLPGLVEDGEYVDVHYAYNRMFFGTGFETYLYDAPVGFNDSSSYDAKNNNFNYCMFQNSSINTLVLDTKFFYYTNHYTFSNTPLQVLKFTKNVRSIVIGNNRWGELTDIYCETETQYYEVLSLFPPDYITIHLGLEDD